MRKSTSLFFIVLILLTGCSTQTPKDEHIVVGVTAPFSGDLAVYGDAFKNGIQLAQEDLGSNSKIEFIL